MKRSIKNIIVISIIAILCGGFFFTAKAAVNSVSTGVSQVMNINGQEGMDNPPDMPSQSDSTSDDSSDTNTLPELPSEQGDSNMTPPDMSDSSSSESAGNPPEMPSGQSGQAPSGGPGDSSNMGNPPEKPDGETSNTSDSESGDSTATLASESIELTSQEETSSEVSIQEMPQMNNDVSNEDIDVIYYVALGMEAFGIFALVLYMIMSKANALTFKETMKSSDKYVILVLATALLTTGTLLVADKVMGLEANSDLEVSEANQEMGGQAPEGQPGESQGTSTASYSGATTISEDSELSDTTYSSTNSDENALLVSGDITVTADNIIINKTGDSDGGDSSNFYGTNSGIIAKDGAKLTITNATITTDGDGANGVFSYGGSATTSNSSSDGTTVTISDSTITTTGDNAGGIMTTGGGITYASNLTITTSGTSSAAIRSDRGGGTVVVDGGTYTTNGKGSPAVYSTSNTSVSNATLISNTSEGIVIEGKNSVTIDNVTLTDTNDELNGQSTTYKNIFLYQSMSGDADNGTAEFTATDSTITTNVGDTFYVTNTSATITLTNNVIVNNDSTGNFLRIQADSWGNTGSNGGDVTLIMVNQDGEGSIVVDSISTLNMSLTQGSSFTGVINGDNTAESIALTIDASSTLTLTGDTYVTSLEDGDTTYSNINFNGYTLYVNGVAIN